MIDDLVTVVITSSPTPLHPSTEHLEMVVHSIRQHLPQAEIIIAFDGCRNPEDKTDYDEYIRRALWLTNHHWANTLPVLAPHWEHQANLTRRALEFVPTPAVLMVEHDCPICPDPIDWEYLTGRILVGEANHIRFHFEGRIHPEHLPLMIDPQSPNQQMIRTFQWSHRPHLASVAYYERILEQHFPPSSRGFIEDRMHSIVQEAWRKHGETGWAQHRLWLYTPPGPHIKRSDHLDSRAGAEKAPAWVG